MIDIHSHILYGVDDGCKTLDDSINMIREIINAGVTDLVLTPHFSHIRNFAVSYKEIESKFNFLKEEVTKKSLKINLFLGSEIDEDTDILSNVKLKKAHFMNDTKYVLIDFGYRNIDVDEVCYELIINGYKPIIAHPERYFYINGIDRIEKWKKTGALIQIDASSIFSRTKAKKISRLLLKQELVDVIASDTHRSIKTIEYFIKAYNYIQHKYGIGKAIDMFETIPRRIIGNSKV